MSMTFTGLEKVGSILPGSPPEKLLHGILYEFHNSFSRDRGVLGGNAHVIIAS